MVGDLGLPWRLQLPRVRGREGRQEVSLRLLRFLDHWKRPKASVCRSSSTMFNVLTRCRFMALIELAESVFAVSQVVVCLDRSVGDADRKAFMKSLRWVGFELITLDMWTDELDVTSDRWMFLGMEV